MTRLRLSLEEAFLLQLQARDLPKPQEQFRWHPKRKWRADFAYPVLNLLIEIDGGTWITGTGHNSGAGKTRDCEKDAEAAISGWHVMRFPTQWARSGRGADYVERYIHEH